MHSLLTRLGANAPGLPAGLLPPPAPLPSLSTAFSRRRAILGAVALAAAPVAALPVTARPATASTLSPNDARLVAIADAYEALERECNAHTEAHRGRSTPEIDDAFDDLASGLSVFEDEMTETPAETIVGILAKARACQSPSLRDFAEHVSRSAMDDLWRLYGAGGFV